MKNQFRTSTNSKHAARRAVGTVCLLAGFSAAVACSQTSNPPGIEDPEIQLGDGATGNDAGVPMSSGGAASVSGATGGAATAESGGSGAGGDSAGGRPGTGGDVTAGSHSGGSASLAGGSTNAGGAPSSGGAPSASRASNGPAKATMYVDGRNLYTHCGEKIVLRGVNHPTIYIDRAGDALPEIAKTGANVVRLFWYAGNGVSITEAEASISRAIENGMVPVLEMHDATGPANWGKMSTIVSYWTSSEAVALIKKYEHQLIINIANEAGPDAGQNYDGFQSVYEDAITSIRAAGIDVPIMIDASGWGRHYEVLFQRGPALIQHDPRHNVLLSAHLYDTMSREQIAGVYQRAVDAKLPFLVGEFANRSPVGTCGPELDYLALIGEAKSRDIGWLAWSWGDYDSSTWWNGDCWEFDMTTTLSFDSLERWGKQVAVTDANSLKNTATRPASLTSGSCD